MACSTVPISGPVIKPANVSVTLDNVIQQQNEIPKRKNSSKNP